MALLLTALFLTALLLTAFLLITLLVMAGEVKGLVLADRVVVDD